MAEHSILRSKLATLIIELFEDWEVTTTIVGTTATAIPDTTLANRKAVLIQNKHASNTLYLSNDSLVTASDTALTGGYELGPGDAVVFPLDGTKQVWSIASGATTAACTVEFK